MRTFVEGAIATDSYGHVGWPVDPEDALDRVQRGLPVYWPTDPTSIDLAPSREFAERRGPNSE